MGNAQEVDSVSASRKRANKGRQVSPSGEQERERTQACPRGAAQQSRTSGETAWCLPSNCPPQHRGLSSKPTCIHDSSLTQGNQWGPEREAEGQRERVREWESERVSVSTALFLVWSVQESQTSRIPFPLALVSCHSLITTAASVITVNLWRYEEEDQYACQLERETL